MKTVELFKNSKGNVMARIGETEMSQVDLGFAVMLYSPKQVYDFFGSDMPQIVVLGESDADLQNAVSGLTATLARFYEGK